MVKNRSRRADNQSDFPRKAEQGLLKQKPPFWLFYPAMRYRYFTLFKRQKAVLFFGQTLRHPIIKRLTCFVLQLHNILPFPLLNSPSIPSKKLSNSRVNVVKPFFHKNKEWFQIIGNYYYKYLPNQWIAISTRFDWLP